jgi:hypothetical protein
MRGRDLDFISGAFMEAEVPKEYQYLLKYFTTDVQVMFLKYWFYFFDIECFQSYTGLACEDKYKKALKRRLDKIISVYNEAKSNFDIEKTWQIEQGKYKY